MFTFLRDRKIRAGELSDRCGFKKYTALGGVGRDYNMLLLKRLGTIKEDSDEEPKFFALIGQNAG